MRRYVVTIEYHNGRKNSLVKWADSAEEAKRLALRDWGSTFYKNLDAYDSNYGEIK